MGDFVIFPKELFEIGTLTGKHYAVHLCAGEWRLKTDDSRTFKNRVKKLIGKWPWLFDKVQIMVRKKRYDRLKTEIPFYAYSVAQQENRPLPEL